MLDSTSPVAGGIRITALSTSFEWQCARALIMDYIEWVRAALSVDDPYTAPPSLRAELAGLATHYTPPRGRMVMAWLHGIPMGVVGVRARPDGTAEMKRLYVRPAGRGYNLGVRLVQRTLELAAELGCHTLRLETMPGLMDRAIALYRRFGFTGTHPFGDVAIDEVIYLERPVWPDGPLVA